MIQSLLYYLLESTLILGAGLLLYYAYFSKKLTASYARIYLLAFAIMSVCFPAVNVPIIHLPLPSIATIEETSKGKERPSDQINVGPMLDQEVILADDELVAIDGKERKKIRKGTENISSTSFNWIALYLTICGGLLIFTCLQFASFFRLVRSSESLTYRNRQILLSNDPGVSGLSFLGYIVISKKYYGDSLFDIILSHELAHHRLGHSWDILGLRLLSCILWPNLLIRVVEREIKRVHEYEADMATSSQIEKKDYIRSLIDLSVPSVRTFGVHSFAKANITGRLQQLTSPVLHVASQVKYSLLLLVVSIFIVASCTQLNENAMPDLSKEQLYGKLRSVTTTYHSNQPDTRQKDNQVISKVEFSETGEILIAETYMDYPYDYDEPQPIRLIGDVEKSDLLHTMDGLSLEAAGNPILYGARWPTLLMMKAEEGTHKYKHEYRQNVLVAVENHSDQLPKSIHYYEELDGVGAQWALDVKDIFNYDEQGRVIHHEVKSGAMYRNEYEKKTDFQYDNNGKISNVSNARNSFDITFDRKELSVFKKYLNDEVVNTRKYFYDKNGLKTKTEVYNRYGDLEYTVLYEYDFFE